MKETPSDTLPPTLDLSSLREKLVATGAFLELADKIKRALAAQSCLGDMREARDCFEALQDLLKSARGWKSRGRDTTEAALLASAVLLYARATVTQAARPPGQAKSERGPSQIKDALTEEEQADHQALTDTRSQALAHVYFDHEVAGVEWHIGATLAVKTDDGWLPGGATRRVRLDPLTVSRLSRAIPTALRILESRVQNRFLEVRDALEKGSGPELDRLLGDCWLDPVRFFGSVEAAALALKDIQPGAQVIFEG